MTSTHSILWRFKHLWLSAWPLWTFAVFASLAVVRLLPEGYLRAVVAAPIVLLVPGSLTLGAVFSRRHRPQGVEFVCYAALLGAVWSVFASLGLYVCHVFISADNTYWCLLIVSAALTIVAEARLLLSHPGRGRRVANKPEAHDPDLSSAEIYEAGTPKAARGAGLYSIVAVVAGVSLLAGGVYAYDHYPNPAHSGYTWIAWAGSPIKGDITVGSAGITLLFQIVHDETDTTTFRLSAAWLGTSSKPLARPLALSIGPNQTFQGSLFIPPLPDGCTYRIVMVLTAARRISPLTKKPQTWSINADVHDPYKSLKTCKLSTYDVSAFRTYPRRIRIPPPNQDGQPCP